MMGYDVSEELGLMDAEGQELLYDEAHELAGTIDPEIARRKKQKKIRLVFISLFVLLILINAFVVSFMLATAFNKNTASRLASTGVNTGVWTSDHPQIRINMDTPYGQELVLPYNPDMTVEELMGQISTTTGIDPTFLAVFRARPLLDPQGRHTHRDRHYLLSMQDPEQKGLAESGVKDGDVLDCYIRPLRGDHLHYAFAIYYKDKLVRLIDDRPLFGYQAEGTHIAQVNPHFGVHAGSPGWFSDGLIHIHPATTWQWFEATEGLGCNLDAFLEQIGVKIWESDSHAAPDHFPINSMNRGNMYVDFEAPVYVLKDSVDGESANTNVDAEARIELDPAEEMARMGGALTPDGKHSLGLPPLKQARLGLEEVLGNVGYDRSEYAAGHTIIGNDDEYMWRVYHWPSAERLDEFEVIQRKLGRIWLPHNHGMVTLSYEKRTRVAHDTSGEFHLLPPHEAPQPRPESIKELLVSTSSGFDGFRYPSSSSFGIATDANAAAAAAATDGEE